MTNLLRRPVDQPVRAGHRDTASGPARASRRGDGGFVLLETIVTVSLITIIMAALATFFLNAVASTNQQRARQTATQVADTAVGKIQGLQASNLVSDRGSTAVANQFAAASPTAVQPWLASMEKASDASVAPGSGASAAVPTVATNQTVNKVVYSVNTYLGWCGVMSASEDSPSPDCNVAGIADGTTYLRAVVAVTWRDKRCADSQCAYLTATLISTSDDPTFNLYQTPPTAPIVVDPGAQNSVVAEPVSLALAVATNTGVPQYTWQVTGGALPDGLGLNPAGLISGSPTTPVSNQSVTVTVTDAFLRTASRTFLWTIVPPLTIVAPGDQTSTRTVALSPALTLTASGGAGPPYTWSDPTSGLPPGLVLSTVNNQGRISGTPTVAGTFAVQLTVKDATTTRTATVSFSWRVNHPPFAAGTPNDPRSTVSRVISPVQLTTSGGSGSSVWSGAGSLPPGLSLTDGGLITGTPTTTGIFAVQLSVNDTAAGQVRAVAFTWTVFAAPTVSPPSDRVSRIGDAIQIALVTTCPNSPCTYTLLNGPATLTITSTGRITGTITSGMQIFPSVTIRVQDRVGSVVTTTPFTWTITSYAAAVNATGGLLSYWRLGEAPPPPSPADVLISQGKPAAASSVESTAYPASAAVDGNATSRWSSLFTDPQWIRIDLGVTSKISQVVLNWEAAYGKSFELQTSNDTVTWTPIYQTTSSTGGNQTLNVAGSGRYIRMYGTERSGGYGYSLFEFKVYGVNAPPTYPRAADSKGSNTGDYRNEVTLGAAGALTGDSNTAARFDGVNDYVQATGTTGLPTGAGVRSVELWFKTNSSARQVFFDYGTTAQNAKYALWLNAGGASMTAWGFGGGADKNFPLPVAVNDGNWHQVVTTYDGTTLKLYVDGILRGSQAATRATVLDAYGFNIGAVVTPNDSNSGGYFNGFLDEVSFYTTALSEEDITRHYQLGTPTATNTGPSGGSVDAAGLVGTGDRYAAATQLSVVFSAGTDQDGLAGGAELRRATASLTSVGGKADGACGAYSSYGLVADGTDPVSPKSDTVADQACYRYQYVVRDTLDNLTTYTSPDIKVDRTAPSAPALEFSGFSNSFWAGGTSTQVFYRSGQPTGGFTVTASASDSASGIASYGFANLGTNWSSAPGALGVNAYSWSGTPAAATPSVTAGNHAGVVSAGSPFTLTPDNTAPTAGTVTYPNGSVSSLSVSVGFTTGTDGGSGLGTRLLQRATAPLTGSVCGTFGGFATVAGGTDPASPLVNTVATGNCYKYQYVVADRVGNAHTAVSANIVKVNTYAAAVTATDGLLSYWRLGEPLTALTATDAMIGGTGSALTSHAADLGGTWTNLPGTVNTEKISSQDRAYRLGTGGSVNYLPAAPPTSDYSVEADLVVRSVLAGDSAGVVARLNTTATRTFYVARWEQADTSWNIAKYSNGTLSYPAFVRQQPAMTVDQTSRVRLEVDGNGTSTTLRLYVNGMLTVGPVTDTTSALQNTGRAGIIDGELGGSVTKSDTSGLHIDNFQVTPATYPRAVDTQGVRTGDYENGVVLGAAGALADDANTAARLDGGNDHVQVTATAGLPTGAAARSVELWFKTTGSARQVLFDYGSRAQDAKFALWLNPGGTTMTAWGYGGSSDKTFQLPAALNDGGWHHVVKTYNGSSITLYIDGVALPSQTATRATALDAYDFNIGAVVTPGDSNSGGFFNGTIDEVSFYAAAMSPADVVNHYQLGNP